MKKIEPKRVVGVHNDPTVFFTIRMYHTDDMQEFLCPDGKEKYERENKIPLGTPKILATDSEEQLRYNAFIENIADYDDYDEYKYKTSFKYKVLKFLKLVK